MIPVERQLTGCGCVECIATIMKEAIIKNMFVEEVADTLWGFPIVKSDAELPAEAVKPFIKFGTFRDLGKPTKFIKEK